MVHETEHPHDAKRTDLHLVSIRQPTTLTVNIVPHRTKAKARHYFKSDDEFNEHERAIAVYQREQRSVELSYKSSPSTWTATDIDAVVATVLNMLERLPVADAERCDLSINRRSARGCAGAVGFDICTTRNGRRFHMWLTCLLTPYRAEIVLQEPPPVTAIVGLIEYQGYADVTIGVRPRGGYMPKGGAQ